MEVKVGLYYDKSDEDTAAALDRVTGVLIDSGIDVEIGSVSPDADFLLVLASNSKYCESKEIADAVEGFLGDVKWKRRDFGEVVIVDFSQVSFAPSRLSYALKKCKRFAASNLDALTQYITTKASRRGEGGITAQTVTPISREKEIRTPELIENSEAGNAASFNSDSFLKEADASGEDTVEVKKTAKDRAKKDLRTELSDDGIGKKGIKTSIDPFEEYPDYRKQSEHRPKNAGASLTIVIFGIAVLFIVMVIIMQAARMPSFTFSVQPLPDFFKVSISSSANPFSILSLLSESAMFAML